MSQTRSQTQTETAQVEAPPRAKEAHYNLNPKPYNPRILVLSSFADWSQAIAAIGCGLVFGFALHKSDIFRASTIRGQLTFQDWTVLKVFLTAAAVSTAVITAFYKSENSRLRIQQIADAAYNVDVGLLSTVLGGFLLGVGIALSGSSPGLAWVQLGAGSVSSLFTIAGGLLGAIAFGMHYDAVSARLARIAPLPRNFLGDNLNLGRIGGATVLIATLSAIVAGLEAYYPSSNPKLVTSVSGAYKLEPVSYVPYDFMSARYPPVIAGLVLGALQVPLILYLGTNLGTVASYVTLVTSVTTLRVSESSSYLRKFRDGFGNWWQPLFVLAAAVGSFLAWATSTDDTLYDVVLNGIPERFSFLGGMLAVFGALMAGGGPSENAISGLGHQCVRSFIAMAAMIGGGALTMSLINQGILGFTGTSLPATSTNMPDLSAAL